MTVAMDAVGIEPTTFHRRAVRSENHTPRPSAHFFLPPWGEEIELQPISGPDVEVRLSKFDYKIQILAPSISRHTFSISVTLGFSNHEVAIF